MAGAKDTSRGSSRVSKTATRRASGGLGRTGPDRPTDRLLVPAPPHSLMMIRMIRRTGRTDAVRVVRPRPRRSEGPYSYCTARPPPPGPGRYCTVTHSYIIECGGAGTSPSPGGKDEGEKDTAGRRAERVRSTSGFVRRRRWRWRRRRMTTAPAARSGQNTAPAVRPPEAKDAVKKKDTDSHRRERDAAAGTKSAGGEGEGGGDDDGSNQHQLNMMTSITLPGGAPAGLCEAALAGRAGGC